MHFSTVLAGAFRPAADSGTLAERYRAVRAFTRHICEPLEIEDMVIQSMPDASPTRWHLAHTTWFFETMVLTRARPKLGPFHADFQFLFNSYYNLVGAQFPRPNRGFLSRPTISQVIAYRDHVDQHMLEVLADLNEDEDADLRAIVEIGLNHEQQHQELILTDIKHVFSCNPLYPVYRERDGVSASAVSPLRWRGYEEGVREIGHDGEGFVYDNELPRHRDFVHAFEIANRLVTNGEFLEFMEDGGYRRAELWLSEGWATVEDRGWRAPLYWEERDEEWYNFTMSGLRRVEPAEPVCHVSHFEADAYARWKDARLPREAEWEIASERAGIEGNFVESENFHPVASPSGRGIKQLYGDVWEWTASPYVGYPGYRPPDGPIGEYNGKFMSNQMVLRGGSCVTSQSHIRRTYRNFFPSASRWQFSGFRLARDAAS